MIELTPHLVRALRTRAQGLYQRRPPEDLQEVIRTLCGVQAQLSPAMLLALRARVSGLTANDVEDAIRRRQVVRSWSMRGTLHLIHSEDVRWLVALLGPIFAAKGKRRREELGLNEETCAQGLMAIRACLTDHELMTRAEIVDYLIQQGIEIDPDSQAPAHLISLAALEGIVCRGPDRPNGEALYVLLDRWVDQSGSLPTIADALTELAHRYLASYGPATSHDFAAWSGLNLTSAKRAWEQLLAQGQLIEVRVEGRTVWLLASGEGSQTDGPVVRLLSAFDNYVLGYADRAYVVPNEYQREVYHGGQTVPVVLVDGLAVGAWRYKRQGKRLNITIKPFGALDEQIQHLIEQEADDIRRFWGEFTSVTVTYSQDTV